MPIHVFSKWPNSGFPSFRVWPGTQDPTIPLLLGADVVWCRQRKKLRTIPTHDTDARCLLWLGWLACCAQPWLGLAWACLACLALAWSSNNNRPPSAAGGGFAAAVVAGKAGKRGPGQTKPTLGTTGKPAKPSTKQGGLLIRSSQEVF